MQRFHSSDKPGLEFALSKYQPAICRAGKACDVGLVSCDQFSDTVVIRIKQYQYATVRPSSSGGKSKHPRHLFWAVEKAGEMNQC